MCKQHALRIAWTIARSIAFLDFRVLRWKFTYDWKCVNTTYRVPLFCPLPASRKGLRLTLRSALFGEGGRDWRPCLSYQIQCFLISFGKTYCRYLIHLSLMDLPTIINWTNPFPNLGVLSAIFHLCSNFDRIFCKQTVETLIRHRVLRRLTWVCTICLCPTKRTLGLYGLKETPRWCDPL